MKIAPGSTFERWTVIRLTERGGLCSVYQARDAAGHDVSLHCVSTESVDEPECLAQDFQQIAARLAQLRHPHRLRVEDFGQREDLCWLVSELAPPDSLRDLTRKGLETRRLLGFLSDVASALNGLHANGIVHKDLNPTIIRVGDHALLHVGGDWIVSTLSSGVVGNPRYYPPELLQGLPVGPAGDVYSLGMIAYEALTGATPFGDDGLTPEIYRKLAVDLSPRPGRELPDQAVAIFKKCFDVAPERRWPSAPELIPALIGAMQ
jgi:serine/threonine protein kinase